MGKEFKKIITENRKARFNYFFIEQFEAGMVLKGTEVKSLRQGRAHLKDAYARIEKGEVYVHQMHIGQYPFAHYDNHDPLRPRKLLLNKQEIKRLYGKVNEKGFSLIPVRVYFKNGKAKLTLALAKGKKSHDKRETIRRRDQKRDFERQKKEHG